MLIEGGLPNELMDVFRRGFRVLIDKDEVLEKLSVAPEGVPSPPTVQDFTQHVNDFLYHAVWTAKKVRRGELWVAKSCCDGYMKRLLLRMMEWQARAIHGWDYDTWFEGRFLEKWAEPGILADLSKTFAHYEVGDIKNALLQTVELHRRLTKDACRELGYVVPDDKYSEILPLVRSYVGCPSQCSPHRNLRQCQPVSFLRHSDATDGRIAKLSSPLFGLEDAKNRLSRNTTKTKLPRPTSLWWKASSFAYRDHKSANETLREV